MHIPLGNTVYGMLRDVAESNSTVSSVAALTAAPHITDDSQHKIGNVCEQGKPAKRLNIKALND